MAMSWKLTSGSQRPARLNKPESAITILFLLQNGQSSRATSRKGIRKSS